MPGLMSDLKRLIAIEEIKVLKARYFRAADEKDATLLRSVFSDDVVVDFADDVAVLGGTSPGREPAGGLVEGRDAVCAAIMRAVEHVTTVHHGHTPEITVKNSDTAEGVWAMCDTVWPRPGSAGAGRIGYGHYHERYVRLQDQWRIQSLRLTRIRIERRDVVGSGDRRNS